MEKAKWENFKRLSNTSQKKLPTQAWQNESDQNSLKTYFLLKMHLKNTPPPPRGGCGVYGGGQREREREALDETKAFFILFK